MEAMRKHLLPLATVVTPNLPEASALLGQSLFCLCRLWSGLSMLPC